MPLPWPCKVAKVPVSASWARNVMMLLNICPSAKVTAHRLEIAAAEHDGVTRGDLDPVLGSAQPQQRIIGAAALRIIAVDRQHGGRLLSARLIAWIVPCR